MDLLAYLWLLPVVFPAIGFFWANCPCCAGPQIVTKISTTTFQQIDELLPSGAPGDWVTANGIAYASTEDAIFGCGTYRTTNDFTAIFRVTRNFAQVWAVYIGNDHGTLEQPMGIAALPDGTTCTVTSVNTGFGTNLRTIVLDPDGVELSDSTITGATPGAGAEVISDGTSFFVLYWKNNISNSVGWIKEIDSAGATVSDQAANFFRTIGSLFNGYTTLGGNFYVSHASGANYIIRQVTISVAATTIFTLPAGEALLSYADPWGLHAGSDGNLYFWTFKASDSTYRLRSITTAGATNWTYTTSTEPGRGGFIASDGTNIYSTIIQGTSAGTVVVLMSDGSFVDSGAMSPALTASGSAAGMIYAGGDLFFYHGLTND